LLLRRGGAIWHLPGRYIDHELSGLIEVAGAFFHFTSMHQAETREPFGPCIPGFSMTSPAAIVHVTLWLKPGTLVIDRGSSL